ncbi:nitronate monooxygenase [Variibacter gotjawalensis]|uniref:Nitronate monooxygenase n=1 Tax=Variibacter gotjawalensis TaxID=1333996 RepID=A0A0S3PP72_9BRAD|nr:nitronate monooxygenase [Variibacter gotjawalensis]NIK47977.1 nitronate monooxygenase [Variibacter gotjawalensis]RZS49854.1 nitronate monooxygenase [Variibacter gotjawalensis]BAT57683.1 nitronate monooxygenase [Variibacter gotjawalensis]
MRQTQKLLDLLKIDIPLILAPMAGVSTPELVAAVSNAGGLGSYGCAMLSPEQLTSEAERMRGLTNRSFNLNFFCHTPPKYSEAQETAWQNRLSGYHQEHGVSPQPGTSASRNPFDEKFLELTLAINPRVVSFHFGLPPAAMMQTLKDVGIVILASATTVAEARWLAEHGTDIVIAQGAEAGGHRGIFLDPNSNDVSGQIGTFALVPQIVDAVDVPVIAAGGITDARGVAAAFMLGADAVQIGTAYMFTPEAKVSALHRGVLKSRDAENTALTNLFTGRPARGVVNRLMRELGPINDVALPFPAASAAVAPLRAAAEKQGLGDFTPLWSGQAAALGREVGAAELTRQLYEDGAKLLASAPKLPA